PAMIADRYLAVWNETDPHERKARLSENWTENAAYADPLMRGQGHAQIDALIEAVQARFPGFRFALLGEADGHGEHVRFSWWFGPEGADAVVKGTDFIAVEGGRIAEVVGFLDEVPAAAA